MLPTNDDDVNVIYSNSQK